jgi:hypothetical protein
LLSFLLISSSRVPSWLGGVVGSTQEEVVFIQLFIF